MIFAQGFALSLCPGNGEFIHKKKPGVWPEEIMVYIYGCTMGNARIQDVSIFRP